MSEGPKKPDMTTQPGRLTAAQVDLEGWTRAAELMRGCLHTNPLTQVNNLTVLQFTAMHIIANQIANTVFHKPEFQVEDLAQANARFITEAALKYLEKIKTGEVVMQQAAPAVPKISIVKG